MTEQKLKPNEVELSTGVRLLCKAIPPGIFINISAQNPPPLPPTYKTGEGKDAQYWTNPDDPGYIEARQFWDTEQSKVLLNAVIIHGTEVTHVPKGFPKIEDERWVDEIEIGGTQVHRHNDSWRRLWWTLSKAAQLSTDFEKIQEVVIRLSGVPETDVESASNFPERP